MKDGLALDLCYEEDFAAQADFNVVLTDRGEVVEIQGAPKAIPSPAAGWKRSWPWHPGGLESMFAAQREALRSI